MRVLFLEQHPQFIGGSERIALSLCAHAVARGHEASLAYETAGDLVPAFARAGAECRERPIRTVAVRRPIEAWRSIRHATNLVRLRQVDVLFTSQVSYASLLAAVGARTGVRTVMHLGLVYDYPSPVFRRSIRRLSAGIAPSEATAAGWRARGWPAESLHVIPNGIDLETFTPGDGRAAARRRMGLDAGAPLVAYVGRIVADKGVFTLMRAFARHRRAGGQGRLVFVGLAPSGEDEELRRIASGERLDPSAWEIRPRTSAPEDVYRAADVVVAPSEWEEPFGLAPLEAMACGTLAIVSDRGVLPRFVAAAGDDAVFPAGDSAALAERLDRWLGQPALREAAAARAAAHVRAQFGFAARGDAYLDLMADLCQ